jgi:hypothetical protein
MQRRQGQRLGQQDQQPHNQPAVEDHGRAVSANLEAAAWYRLAQRALDGNQAIRALHDAVVADRGFGLAIADLNALTGIAGEVPRRQQMSWERHHVEIIRTATAGKTKRAADLLQEHLASVGCDPLALRIVVSLRETYGQDDEFQAIEFSFPGCHPSPWPSSP